MGLWGYNPLSLILTFFQRDIQVPHQGTNPSEPAVLKVWWLCGWGWHLFLSFLLEFGSLRLRNYHWKLGYLTFWIWDSWFVSFGYSRVYDWFSRKFRQKLYWLMRSQKWQDHEIQLSSAGVASRKVKKKQHLLYLDHLINKSHFS